MAAAAEMRLMAGGDAIIAIVIIFIAITTRMEMQESFVCVKINNSI